MSSPIASRNRHGLTACFTAENSHQNFKLPTNKYRTILQLSKFVLAKPFFHLKPNSHQRSNYLVDSSIYTIELSTKSFKEKPKLEFGASLKDFSTKSLLEHLVSEPDFESWVKLLGPPLSVPRTLQKH